MVDHTKDSVTDKFALIYEFNNESPLFARVAQSELEKGNYDSAIKILEKGLEEYPNYPSALIVYAIANAEIGKLSKAKQELSKAFEIIDSDESFEFYVKRLEDIVFNKSRFSDIRGSSFVTEGLQTDHEEETAEEEAVDTEEQEALTSVKKENEFPKDTPEEPQEVELPSKKSGKSSSIDDNLEELVNVISKAKIKKEADPDMADENDDTDGQKTTGGDEIVSETMASIYRAQGKYNESIKIYKKLIIKNPPKKDYYLMKIREIEKTLSEENE